MTIEDRLNRLEDDMAALLRGLDARDRNGDSTWRKYAERGDDQPISETEEK